MRNALAVLVLLVVGGGIVFLLLPGRAGRPVADDRVGDGGASATAPAAAPAPKRGGSSLAAPTPRARPPRASPDGGPIRDEGAIRVAFAVPAGSPAPSGTRIDIESLGAGLSSYPLALPQDDGTWLYESLPIGSYRLRAVVAGYQVATVVAAVKKDEETFTEIRLAHGGDVAWKAVLLSGEAPETVRLVLLDARGRAIEFALQTATTLVHLAAAPSVDLRPAGTLVGLRPGGYRLRATAPSGESDEQAVEVKAGEAAAVELKIRK